MPGPTLDVHCACGGAAGGAGATLAIWPAATVTLPDAAAARLESIVTR